jgi:catechol 2,3-dioxygenase-like lactoylglutathione lyase family enzyme
MTIEPNVPNPHVKSTSMICGTLVTTDLKRARRMYEEVMDMECVEPSPGLMYVRDRGHRPGGPKHGKPYWVLEVREKEEIPVGQEMLNHWGFEVASQAAVDEAYEKLSANKAEYGITRVQKPFFRNGSYAVYFVDKDTNWWEVEYRTPDITYAALRAKNVQVVDQA